MAKKSKKSLGFLIEHDIAQLLSYNVPRFISHIHSRGGVSFEEMEWLQNDSDSPDYPKGMLAKADDYILFPSTQKQFDRGIFVLTLALAIMSFFPGGVRIFGIHFDHTLESYVLTE